MTQATLRDLTTNEDIVVPREGFVFGRTGGDADVQLKDNSISRRQAKVIFRAGIWVLETLAVAPGARPPRALTLQEGATFTVGQNRFAVIHLESDEGITDSSSRTVIAPVATVVPTDRRAAPPLATAPSPTVQAAASPPPPASPPTAPAPQPAKRPPAAAKSAAKPAVSAEKPADEQKGVGAMFVAVPKGIAYYLVNVPKMLVNPFGTVRNAIESQPADAMGRNELIGYALPSLLATFLLGSIAGGIATLIAGGGFQLMAFIPIAPAIFSVIGAVITGFIFHPVFEWLIRFLKGESDAKSRSNFFLQFMTLGILLAVPSALGTILSALPVPFIGLVGQVLGVLATLVSLYVTLQWFISFKVVKWFKTVILALGAVLVVLAAIGLVQGVIASVKSLGGGASASAGSVDSADEKPPTDPEELAAWAEKKQKEAAAKFEAEAAKQNAENEAAEVAGEVEAKAAKSKPLDAKAKVAEARAAAEAKVAEAKAAAEAKLAEVKEAAQAKAAEKSTEAKAEPRAAEKEAKAAPEVKSAEPEEASTKDEAGAYAAFARRRDAIEKRFETDPTVLQRNADMQRLYGEYLAQESEVDKKWSKETAKKPERERLNARLRDAELFAKTGKIVDSIAAKLNIR